MNIFIHGSGIKDQLLHIIETDFCVKERNRSKILKERHREVQSRTGGKEKCQKLKSETDQDRAAQISDVHHGATQISMVRDR